LPPFPLLSELKDHSIEYLTRYLDFCECGASRDEGVTQMGKIIGYLEEFKGQQDSGKTDYKEPNK